MKNLLLAVGAIALLGGAALLLLILALHGFAGEGVHIVVNDRELHWQDLPHWDAMGAGMGALLALAAALIAVPLVLLGVLLPLLLVAGALLLVIGLALGVGVIGMAPLLLPLLLLFWLWRRAQRRAARAARAGKGAASDTIDL